MRYWCAYCCLTSVESFDSPVSMVKRNLPAHVVSSLSLRYIKEILRWNSVIPISSVKAPRFSFLTCRNKKRVRPSLSSNRDIEKICLLKWGLRTRYISLLFPRVSTSIVYVVFGIKIYIFLFLYTIIIYT